MRKLNKETWMDYMVSRKDKPKKHPIYIVDTELGSSILYISFEPFEEHMLTCEK